MALLSSFPLVASLALSVALAIPTSASGPKEEDISHCTNATFADILPSYASILEKAPYDETNDPYGILTMATRDGIFGLCGVRVAVSLPESTNTFYLELFLPPASTWNGRLLTVGNYAFKGGIRQKDMFSRLMHGYATMSTNTGHEDEEEPKSLMAWAMNSTHPELGRDRQTDWAWRAMNYSVPMAKDLTKAYYARDRVYSYYSGCSTGGRQGLKQIQMAADSFDGLLIGAPAWETKRLMPAVSKLASHNLPVSRLNSTNSTFARLANHTIKNCDVIPDIDDAKDDIISSPAACLELFRNDPSRWNDIICGKSGDAEPDCITQEQVDIVMEIAQDTKIPGTDELMYEGFDISSIGNWGTFLDGSSPQNFDQDFARYFILQNENATLPWNETSGEATKLLKITDEWDATIQATADKFKLHPSFAGKIIMFQGLADAVIPSGSTLRYYTQTQAAYGGDISSWFRYFPIPGLQHCWNSPESDTAFGAPWYVGAVGIGEVANTTWHIPGRIGLNSSRHDLLQALVEWVEEKNHPPVDEVVATAFRSGALRGFNFQVKRQRLACAYPRVATWDRTNGTEDLVENWSCKMPGATGG